MLTKRWQIIVGIALLLFATVASALSLGRVRGTALIGRGLDLTVQMSVEAQELVPDANCFTVDIFYGDSRVSPSLISISLERAGASDPRIRIRSSSMVDEPVVTLYLRTVCGSTISRRYVLLAETLSDAEPSVAPVPFSANPANSAPPAPPSPASSISARTQSAVANNSNMAAQDGKSASSARQASRQAAREARPSRRERQAARPEAESPAPAADRPRESIMRKGAGPAKTAKPRLQLDLLDLSSYEPSLRSSAELSSMPSGDENVRRQAQTLWRTLNASAEDVLRDTQRLETLETQMRSALEQSKRQTQDIAALSTDLKVAQRARYLNPFTFFLGFLALAAVALSWVFWRRSASHHQPWWGHPKKEKTNDEQHLWEHLSDEAPESARPAKPIRSSVSVSDGFASASNTGAQQAAFKDSDAVITSPGVLAEKGSQGPLRFVEKSTEPLDFAASDKINRATAKLKTLGQSPAAGRGGNMGRVDSTPPPSLMSQESGAFSKSSLLPPGKSNARANRSFVHSDFAVSGFNNARLITTEELFDIQEQADFFMSLGQPDQAIEVLRNHISDRVETSAVAYMDLFNIYHQTGREQDYEQLREEFNRVFNAHVPIFANHGQQSAGLEDYPAVLQNIQAVWHQHQAQQVIEELIFRQPESDQQLMDMTAYRELMTLYALTKELTQPTSGYSMLPSSSAVSKPTQTVDTDAIGLPVIDLGNDLELLSYTEEDMISFDDPTIGVASRSAELGKDLDFDLSQIDDLSDLGELKPPPDPRKS